MQKHKHSKLESEDQAQKIITTAKTEAIQMKTEAKKSCEALKTTKPPKLKKPSLQKWKLGLKKLKLSLKQQTKELENLRATAEADAT